MLKGDQEMGQEWLNRAVEESPDVAALRTQLALTFLAGGETDKAITELKSAVDLGQDVLQADVLLVLAHLKNKEFEQALQASSALEQRMPDSAIPYNLTGLALLAQGEKDKARDRFLKALELDPEFMTAALNIARIEVGNEDLDAAQKQYEGVLAQRPQHLGALLGMAALAERRKDTDAMVSWLEKAREENPTSVHPGLLLTKHYLSQKEALKAMSVATTLSLRFPEDPRVLEMRARAQALSGESANAIRTFEQLARLQPEDAQHQYLVGAAKWKAEDVYGAREAFKKAIAIKPDFLSAKVALASVELQDGRVGDALEIAKKLQKDYPDSSVGYQIEGKIYLTQNRETDALKALETGYEKQKSSQLVRELAKAYADAGRGEDSIKILEGWMTEKPDDLGALGMLAMSYQAAGRDAEAIKAYETLVQNDAKNVVILNNLAWLYQASGDARALETAKQAYELDPDRPEIGDTYGWILLQSGDVQGGLTILQQAYVAFPTQAEIGYHVAVGLSRAERKDEAVKVLRRLLREDLNFPQAQDAKALLEKLEQ
jgi:putative PEP-CTERM system TPR-repeat lipoprotein